MRNVIVVALLLLVIASPCLAAGELVRLVRFKISAGDLTSAIAAAEDYRFASGADPEYLDAIGWIARGAEMLRRPELARHYVDELHRAIPQETAAALIPYGAAIEVEGRLIAATDGRGAAIRYFQGALANAKAISLRSRIRKNINLLSLEGQPALPIANYDLGGKPTLLFFWAAGCGDCKGQAAALQRVWNNYKGRGLQLAAVTRLYGGAPDKPQTPDEEKAEIQKWWNETFPALAGVPMIVDSETMVRYGVSATPTFALVDRHGMVRFYSPTRLSDEDLSRRIDAMIAE